MTALPTHPNIFVTVTFIVRDRVMGWCGDRHRNQMFCDGLTAEALSIRYFAERTPRRRQAIAK